MTCLHHNIFVPSTISPSARNIDFVVMSIRSFLSSYIEPFLHPVSASIISLATRISPTTTQEEYESLLLSSVSKELSAAITTFPYSKLDYRCILSDYPEHRYLSFSERLPPDPEVSADTYQVLSKLRKSLSGMLIFPSIGRKTVGDKVAASFWEEYYRHGCTFKHDGRFDPEESVTTRDCLKLYEETGGYVNGPVEVRTAWKYAQIEPRVYYARGGDVVPSSQFIQPVINRIIDAFPEVHRKNRFSPPDSLISDTDVEIIYDYASFTSSLDAVVEFVDQLSNFFRGTIITIVDVVDGLKQIDLGELFHEYNRDCNKHPDFDITKVVKTWMSDAPLLQHTCGMLGVEGNIFLATLLHGIHLRFVAGLHRSRCVGDDARLHFVTPFGQLPQLEFEYLVWMLSSIGDINSSKVAIFDTDSEPEMQAYRYIKRPLHRDRQIMIEGVLFDIPSLIPLFAMEDRFHTILPTATHPCRATFKSIIRILRILKLHNISMETDQAGISMIADHIQFLVKEIRRLDPKGEHSPFAKSDIHTQYRLPSVKDWGIIDYEDWILDELAYDQEVRFLKQGGEESNYCDGLCGSEMVRESNARRSFLEKMGYLVREDLFDLVSIAQIGMDEMKIYLLGNYRTVCRFRVVEDIPSWYSLIPDTL